MSAVCCVARGCGLWQPAQPATTRGNNLWLWAVGCGIMQDRPSAMLAVGVIITGCCCCWLVVVIEHPVSPLITSVIFRADEPDEPHLSASTCVVAGRYVRLAMPRASDIVIFWGIEALCSTSLIWRQSGLCRKTEVGRAITRYFEWIRGHNRLASMNRRRGLTPIRRRTKSASVFHTGDLFEEQTYRPMHEKHQQLLCTAKSATLVHLKAVIAASASARAHTAAGARWQAGPCGPGAPSASGTGTRHCFLASASGPELWPDVCAVAKL
jgi:hypothetical protein